MSKPEISSRRMTSVVLRYGLAVLSVCIALSAALLLSHYNFPDVADPLFLFAIAIAILDSASCPPAESSFELIGAVRRVGLVGFLTGIFELEIKSTS